MPDEYLLHFLLFSTICISISFAAFQQSDFLKTNGTQLRNQFGQGAVVNLRGVNLGGLFLQEKWMSPMDSSCDKDSCNNEGCGRFHCEIQDESSLRNKLTERFGAKKMEELVNAFQDTWIKAGDLDNLQRMGLNLVRVPIYYMNLMEEDASWKQGFNGKDIWAKLDWLVDECAKRGIYVIFDLHGAFGCQNVFDNCGRINAIPQLWANVINQENTVTLWKGLAEHFKGNPAIAGYDLLNEPDRMNKTVLNDFYDTLYKEIRAVDSDHIIVIEAPWDFEILDHPSERGWTNVMYEMHVYDIFRWYNRKKQEYLVDFYLVGIRNYQNSWHVPVYAGEFCLFSNVDLWEKFLGGLNSMDVAWSHWAYKMYPDDFEIYNWAYFQNNTNPIPNIVSDSAEEIKKKWLKFGTENFEPNKGFQALISKYAKTTPEGNGIYSSSYQFNWYLLASTLIGMLLF